MKIIGKTDRGFLLEASEVEVVQLSDYKVRVADQYGNRTDVPIGSRVEKWTGDYTMEGVVCGFATTPAGKLRYIVAHAGDAGWLLHIYAESNLRNVAS